MGSTYSITDLNLGIETIVEIVGLAVKIGIGPIKGILIGVLIVSKNEMLPKTDATIGGILTKVFTLEELTRTKIGAINVFVDKLVELDEALTIHAKDDANEANSLSEEDGCSSIDEVLDASIDNT